MQAYIASVYLQHFAIYVQPRTLDLDSLRPPFLMLMSDPQWFESGRYLEGQAGLIARLRIPIIPAHYIPAHISTFPLPIYGSFGGQALMLEETY